MSTRVRLDFCCNDPDNGLPSGHVCGVQLPDELLNLEASDLKGPVFRDLDGKVQLGRRRFAYLASKDWFGNWCWNAYWFDIEVAVDLLSWLHRQGTFSRDMGEARLFSRWARPHPFDNSDCEFLGRLLAKAMLAVSSRRAA